MRRVLKKINTEIYSLFYLKNKNLIGHVLNDVFQNETTKIHTGVLLFFENGYFQI